MEDEKDIEKLRITKSIYTRKNSNLSIKKKRIKRIFHAHFSPIRLGFIRQINKFDDCTDLLTENFKNLILV